MSSKPKPKIILQGRLSHKLRSLAVLMRLSVRVASRRAWGKPLLARWSLADEIGVLFTRAQFQHAFALNDIVQGRAYLDSLYWRIGPPPKTSIRPAAEGQPKGHWFIPPAHTRDATMLYFHGGGYTCYCAVTRLFIAMLAETLGLPIFAPDYRMIPEHPHPAQIDDGLAAYRFLLDQGVQPSRLIVGGDSAGGHLMLMTIAQLRGLSLPQPALGIGLSPLTDTRPHGASLSGNDRYDILQSYMTQVFAGLLKGAAGVTDAQLSPIDQDFRGAAPLYLQAGDKEILLDMIRDFAQAAQAQGASVRLDVWPDMYHVFQYAGTYYPESQEALQRIGQAIDWALNPAAGDASCL